MNITKAETLKDVKVGECVFVVKQSRYGSSRDAGAYMEVIKKGRTYGYIEMHRRQFAFHLAGGDSHDKDGNTRVNGMGFDVYVSKAAYIEFESNRVAKIELRNRLRHIVDTRPLMTDSDMQKLNAVLDEIGL